MYSYLSVVAASRNDDHGGDPLIRTQIFINNFARQCDKYRLPAELIIVDWNPVAGRPGLAAVLNVPPEATYLQARVVTVPTALHQRLKYADRLPLFQMIAKNVGVRRAKGKFVLATNIDILFSDELIQFIARQRLDAKKQYRVDRYDIQSGMFKESTLDEVRDYAWGNPIRANRRYQPEKLVQHLYGEELFRKVCIPSPEFREKNGGVEIAQEQDVWQVRPERSVPMSHLHTNACGDFTLLAREGWDAIRGYPEFAAYSFNIDSMGVIAAHYAGYEEVSLLPPCVCFHIEHGIGSGWTPEGGKHLFNRLEKAEILNPEWPVLTPLVDEMREQGRALEFNYLTWGMAEFDLPEQDFGDTTPIASDKLERLAAQAETHSVSSIRPAYDLDRLTLVHERRLAHEQRCTSNLGLTVAARAETVVLYIPNAVGGYSETRSIAYHGHFENTATVIFRLEEFAHQFPLRFDPCGCAGLIKISSITIFDTFHNSIVWELDSRTVSQLVVDGTAVMPTHAPLRMSALKRMFFSGNWSDRQPALYLISTGSDPQLMLPSLPVGVGFPLVLSVEMRLVPSQ